MTTSNRRTFLSAAAAMGASLAWGRAEARPSRVRWTERRDLYPQGVASGDPLPDSVILWTRRPATPGQPAPVLTVEIAEDEAFQRVIAVSRAEPKAESDWTSRVLAAGLKPSSVYFYRFTDQTGSGSRIGRTLTAPAPNDGRPVRFTFVSCQSPNEGAQNAYRRMIFEDERRPADQRLDFVLHLGDFIYEVTVYPEDQPDGRYGRRIRDFVRYPDGEAIGKFHIPGSLGDYRLVYQAALSDPDIQDARARWPFVCMWDNHEFSWQGYQSVQVFGGKARPGAKLKVAANQAWFEHIPSRGVRLPDAGRDVFVGPAVENVLPTTYDEHGLGQEPSNLAAISSLKLWRAFNYGRHLELMLTDNHSFMGPNPVNDDRNVFGVEGYPFAPDEVVRIIDAGRTYEGGNPPDKIRFGNDEAPNWRKNEPPASILGAEQKAWFLDRLGKSRATWKVWGNSMGALDWRADPQNTPKAPGRPEWPADGGYGMYMVADWAGHRAERGEILDFVRKRGITGFGTVAGDRHAFFAGVLAPSLPPHPFEPVGFEFVTGSISSVGGGEVLPRVTKPDDPLRALAVYDPPNGAPTVAAMDFTCLHGVRASFELQATHDVARAKALHNPDCSPHLKFLDSGGHGYGLVTCTADTLTCEFVGLPHPYERAPGEDGGPLTYRVLHTVPLWRPGEAPVLQQAVLEGDVSLHT
ncbi:MAG: alkaline phosphatase D family protein [Caulobacteraceae bacterium]|nr:alkaline phosphatase D family protein [Caulobacteraceae bacterium]